jgi:2-octaprenyl-6-methoxyphenol hydroxylase
MHKTYDITIVGTGLTGLTLAAALSKLPIQVALIDAKKPNLIDDNFHDARSIALSRVSHQIFRSLDLWSAIKAYATPIKKIHISDRGRFAFAHIHASDFKLDALGHVVEYHQLEKSLWNAVHASSNIDYFIPATLTKIQEHNNYLELVYGEQKSIKTKLLVASDGSNSAIRSILNIRYQEKDYKQHALVTNVGINRQHDGVAYERFTSDGPLALLPLGEKRYAIVWTQNPAAATTLLQLPEKEFLAALQKTFGYRVGKFIWVGKRQIFPLRLLYTHENIKSRVALIGNASHTLHPVAGQGFNLGLRDVAHIIQMITDSLALEKDIGNAELLKAYAENRTWDRTQFIYFTNHLINLFSNELLPVVLGRSIGLNAFDLVPSLKTWFASKTMGYSVKLPQFVG